MSLAWGSGRVLVKIFGRKFLENSFKNNIFWKSQMSKFPLLEASPQSFGLKMFTGRLQMMKMTRRAGMCWPLPLLSNYGTLGFGRQLAQR